MDPDISRWVLEFLLRSSVPDSLISQTLAALPLSAADSRLKKTLLLRTLHSLHSKASISETALEILELLDDIDRHHAVPATASIRRAYCAVAVECTLKYLVASPDDAAGNYFAAVRRIWRGRVAKLEGAGRLFSAELAQWRDDLEAAVWEPRVCERLVGFNCRAEALNEVKGYLKEAWEGMGPSFLDSVAALAKAKGFRCDGVLEGSATNDGDETEIANANVNADADDVVHDDGECHVEDENGNDVGRDDGECRGEEENNDKEDELEERVGASIALNHELCAEREKGIQKSNHQLKRKNAALGKCPDSISEFACGSELKKKRDEGVEGLVKQRRDLFVGDRSEPNDISCMENVPVSGEKQRKEQLEERVGTSVDGNHGLGGCDLPAQGEKDIHKGNLQSRCKHAVLRRCHKGVKISGAEQVEPANSRSKHDPLPSAEVKKVRESLKSSSLELRALVEDPLLSALQMSEVVRSNLAAKGINNEPRIENQRGGVDVTNPNVCKSIVPFQQSDANLVKKSSIHCSNVPCPNLMQRKVTARTDEWDDSLDNLPQVAQPRRKKRRWTSLEEDTLRAGVNKFGEGNWATIRSFYSDVFENRSGVDLKDKWRNMMR